MSWVSLRAHKRRARAKEKQFFSLQLVSWFIALIVALAKSSTALFVWSSNDKGKKKRKKRVEAFAALQRKTK